MNNYNSINIPIEIKKIFLRFLQAYYSDHFKYKWDYDVSKTKIIIIDKHAFDLGVANKKPSIVLNRNELMWSFVVRGQLAPNVFDLKTLENLSDTYRNKKYTDLVRCSLNLHILSNNGIVSENIANEVFILISGHKEEFRKVGIHQFIGMGISPEQIIKQRGPGEAEIYGTTVYLNFLYQQYFLKSNRDYNVRVLYNDEELKENIDFFVIDNGTKIKLIKPIVSNNPLKIYFIDAITQENIETTLIKIDELNYLIPDNKSILGYYRVFNNLNVIVHE